ncbi:MAG: hypothetical protein ACREUU_14830 [Gammaproteobacteria bacterium]
MVVTVSQLARVLGGWQVNGITTFQTGFPLAVRVRSDSSQSLGHGAQKAKLQPR